jgi:hypothetical protein
MSTTGGGGAGAGPCGGSSGIVSMEAGNSWSDNYYRRFYTDQLSLLIVD